MAFGIRISAGNIRDLADIGGDVLKLTGRGGHVRTRRSESLRSIILNWAFVSVRLTWLGVFCGAYFTQLPVDSQPDSVTVSFP